MADPTDPIINAFFWLLALAIGAVGIGVFIIATIWKVWHG